MGNLYDAAWGDRASFRDAQERLLCPGKMSVGIASSVEPLDLRHRHALDLPRWLVPLRGVLSAVAVTCLGGAALS
jgi:hypothetical protein